MALSEGVGYGCRFCSDRLYEVKKRYPSADAINLILWFPQLWAITF